MIRRARVLAVLAIVLAGTIGIISSTQTWLEVRLADGGSASLPVPGASAIAVLAPLSLAALALGLALTVVGPALRYAFGVLALAIGAALAVATAQVLTARPVESYASTVTEATGLAGVEAVAGLVATATTTAWPVAALAGWVLMVGGGAVVLLTAHRWRHGGRRYRTAAEETSDATPSRPHDAIDSWDDLSRGADPTAR